MYAGEIRRKYIEFFISKGHKEIGAASLVPENDPTTLFTSSGMQPLVSYLLGQEHSAGKKLVNSQPSFRAEDIEEVGDNRHTTFFEMLGNWSLGDYFKKEQLSWIWEFLTEVLKLHKEKLHVSVFEGDENVPKDTESFEIWKSLGVNEDHIHFYGAKKNWWSRSGPPEKMPVGEIGGPDSEIFYEFTQVEHDLNFGEKCHPNCDCGRFLEIGNSVFIQYQKQEDGSLKELEQKNVDFGGGLERLTAATENEPDIFRIEVFEELTDHIETATSKKYSDEQNQQSMRIIADHIRTATFLILSGVTPSNKLQGYVLRRLLRRAAIKFRQLSGALMGDDRYSGINTLGEVVVFQYTEMDDNSYGIKRSDWEIVCDTINEETVRFEKTLDKGLKEVEKIDQIDGKKAFDLYQTYGFPYEVTEELFKQKGQEINHEQFIEEFKRHQDLSRTASAGMFKGGLADHSDETIRGHTATHLLHQALRDVLGESVHQTGSNITPERIRFDFAFNRKLTDDEIKKVEEIVNQKVQEDLPVHFEMMTLNDAKKTGAIGLFDEKYSDNVKVYFIGGGPSTSSNRDGSSSGRPYSAEFCGGPHVEHTSLVGHVRIVKETAAGAGSRRIYMELQ